MMIKAVLFDFDGVLTTDKTGSATTARYLGRVTGIGASKIQSAFRPFNEDLNRGRATYRGIWDDFCARLGARIDIGQLDAAFASTPMDDDMLALARRLRDRYAVGIVTDNKKERIERLEKMHELRSMFEPIVVSADVGSCKDEPAIFEVAVRRLGLDADQCVFVDNDAANLEAPAAMGMATIFFDDSARDFAGLLDALARAGVRDA